MAKTKPSRKTPNQILVNIIKGEFKTLRRSLKRSPKYADNIVTSAEHRIITQLDGYEVIEVKKHGI